MILLAWSALAFGAVYVWAYAPLLLLCAAFGLGGLLWSRDARRRFTWSVAVALTLLVVAVAVQLVPLSRERIVSVSPSTDALLQQYDVPYAFAVRTGAPTFEASHTFSIRPDATRRALTFLVVLSLLLLGAARLLSAKDVHGIARGLLVLGVVVALAGIFQRASSSTRVYGVWQPEHETTPFAPFVNRNHFAGWMVMALPPVVGYWCALVGSAMRERRERQIGWRDRVLWFSSPEANIVILVAFGIFVMGLAVVVTTSRSGITAMGAGLTLVGYFAARRQGSEWRRTIALGYVAFLGIATVAWVGLHAVLERFAAVPGSNVGGRLGTWRDAWRVVQDFPLVGTGLNTYPTAMLFYQTTDPRYQFVAAHNDYLQLAAEGGLLVGLAAGILIVVFALEVRRRFRSGADDRTSYCIRVGAVAGLLGIALQETVEFSLQIPGNAVLFVILCAIALRWPAPSVRRDERPVVRSVHA